PTPLKRGVNESLPSTPKKAGLRPRNRRPGTAYGTSIGSVNSRVTFINYPIPPRGAKLSGVNAMNLLHWKQYAR
ncbi:MAG: hypothetical protein WCQ21_05845, partial [Verrucomicrobiota bacterium]